MNRFANISILIAEVLVMLISVVTTEYLTGALVIFLLSLLRFILKLSDGSFFLELIYLHGTLSCLLMPYLGYTIFTKNNSLARLWVRSMPVNEQQYFGFILPATVCMALGFFLLRQKSNDDHTMVNPLVSEIKQNIQTIPKSSIIVLCVVGLIAHAISPFLPDALQQVNTFLYFSFFTSIFYIYYYKNFPYRKLLLAAAVAFIIRDTLLLGMFTIITYMGGIFLILILAGKKIRFINRLLFLVAAFAFIGFIQLFKINWRQAVKDNRADLGMVVDKTVSKANGNQVETVLFPIYMRMNQGFNIGLVMRKIPNQTDYLGGDYLGLTFASAFVPRLLWPDKPIAGGAYNMQMYTGVNIKGWSTNIGPLGEAYGNFGFEGGWLYMFLFGLFIRVCYTRFLDICKRQPLLFTWMPVLFFQLVYVMETDSLQAFNSLVKGTIFLFVIYKVLPALFPKRKVAGVNSHFQEAKTTVPAAVI